LIDDQALIGDGKTTLTWSAIIFQFWSAIKLIGVWLAVEKPDLTYLVMLYFLNFDLVFAVYFSL